MTKQRKKGKNKTKAVREKEGGEERTKSTKKKQKQNNYAISGHFYQCARVASEYDTKSV